MKRYIALIAVIIVAVSCIGCGKMEYTAPISVKITGDGDIATAVEDFVSERLLEILNTGNWEEGLCDCVNQFYLTVNGHKIGYSTGCMTFNNTTNRKSLKLDNATAGEVEEILCSLKPDFMGDEFIHELEGEVTSVSTGSITVKTELYDGLGIVVSTRFVEGFGHKSDVENIKTGDRVRVLYDGRIAESYPPQILSVYSINIADVP